MAGNDVLLYSVPSDANPKDARLRAVETLSLNSTFETFVINNGSYANKFNGVTLNVTFTPPVSAPISFWGFFDGCGNGTGNYQTGNVWKMRCLCTEVGTWSYSYTWSDATPGGSGTFTVVSDAGNLPGPVKIYATNPYWFQRDGQPLFLKSYYIIGGALIGKDIRWAGPAVYQKIIDAGYNHLQLMVIPLEFTGNPVPSDGPTTISGRLWDSTSVFQTWRLDWAKSMDEHIAWLSARGIAVTCFGGFDGKPAGGVQGVSRWQDMISAGKDFYVQHLATRLGPYPAIAGWNYNWETDDPTTFFGDETTVQFELQDRLITYDKFLHLRSYHDEAPSTNSFSDSRVTAGFFENHAATGGTSADLLPPSHHSHALEAYASKPPYLTEPNGMMREWNPAETDVHRNGWAAITAGASFTWSDLISPFTSADIFNLWKTAKPRIAYLHAIMSTEVAWYAMVPHDDLLSSFTGTCYCLANPGTAYIVYRDENGGFSLTIANTMSWVGEWINTRTNARSSAGSGTGAGTPVVFTPPASPTTEWVLKVTLAGSTPVSNTAVVNLEALIGAASARSLLLEALISVALARNANIESPIGITQARAETFEALNGVVQTATGRLEALAAAAAAHGLSLEALVSAAQVRAANIEALQGIAAGRTVNLEALGQIAAARGISLEALLTLVEGRTPSVESLLSVAQVRAENLEALLGIAAGRTVNIEALGQILVSMTAAIPLEALSDSRSARVLSFEALTPALRAVTLTLESLLGISRSAQGVIEVLAGVRIARGANIEGLSALVGTATLPLEALRAIAAAAGVPIEALEGENLHAIVNVVEATAYFQIRLNATVKLAAIRRITAQF